MQRILIYIKYELLPEYNKIPTANLFTEDKFLLLLLRLTIFILICLFLYFQRKICDSEDKLTNKKLNLWKGRA